MKSADVKSGMHIKYGVKHNEKNSKFKVGDRCKNNKI